MVDMIPALVWSFRVYHYIDTHYLNSTRSYVASRIALYPFAPCCSPFCCPFYLRIWRMGSGGPHVLTCVDISCPGTFTTQPYNFSCLCAPTVEKIDILQCFLDKNCTSADFAAALSVCGTLSSSVYAWSDCSELLPECLVANATCSG